MSLKPKKQEVKKMDINFNNIIDNYYSGDIGSEIKQQQQQNNDEEKK